MSHKNPQRFELILYHRSGASLVIGIGMALCMCMTIYGILDGWHVPSISLGVALILSCLQLITYATFRRTVVATVTSSALTIHELPKDWTETHTANDQAELVYSVNYSQIEEYSFYNFDFRFIRLRISDKDGMSTDLFFSRMGSRFAILSDFARSLHSHIHAVNPSAKVGKHMLSLL